MNPRLIAYALFIVVLASSCGKSLFTVEMTLTGNENASYTMQYYAADKKRGMMMETNIALQAGKATQQCACVRPTVVWVMSGPEILTCFYAEKGDQIIIEGETSSPFAWKIGGNDLNEQLTEWRTQNINALKSGNSKDINKAIEAYVTKHKEEKLSAMLLLTTFNRAEDEELYTRLWNSLTDRAKDKKLIDAIGRSDQLGSENASIGANVAQLTLQDLNDSVVTVKPAEYDATLLYFWNGVDGNRMADFDSIKALAKHYDSNKNLRIVDISTATDSVSWKNMARRDSIANHKLWTRLWAPGGVMYKGVAQLNINSVPFFIIIDKRGSQKYRGTSAGDAVKEIKRMVKKVVEIKKDTVKS